jgi:hypothetical protein
LHFETLVYQIKSDKSKPAKGAAKQHNFFYDDDDEKGGKK